MTHGTILTQAAAAFARRSVKGNLYPGKGKPPHQAVT